MSKRTSIPTTLAARVLFDADRTCCVCRQKGKPLQIHHIDSDHANSIYENLAALCLDCHTETQIRGGFHRKLDSDQIILYRDDWKAIVSRGRAQQRASRATDDGDSDVGQLIKEIEEMKARRDYEELIFTFDNLGQADLRDKYIELHLKRDKSFEAKFYFRGLQGRLDLLDQGELKKHIEELDARNDWQDLASAYFRLGDKVNGTKFLAKHVARAIEEGNIFNAAYCFRSLLLNVTPADLFEKSLEVSRQKKDLFWELRALQELEWDDELRAVLDANKDEIATSSLPYDMFQKN
jgi:hypothetical protein